MRIQEYIEEALQDIIEARTYISTNSIAVRRIREGQDLKGDQYVMIEAEPEERLSQNHDFYNVDCAVMAVSKIQQDLDGSLLDALWSDVSDEMTQTLTPATLQAAINAIDATSGITIDGILNMPGESRPIEQYYNQEQHTQIALRYIKP
jgi:hypothetical protein